MTLAEKKIELIRKISEMEDSQLLERIQEWLDFELDESVYQLSEEEQKSIEKGIDQANKKELSPHSEVRKVYERWL